AAPRDRTPQYGDGQLEADRDVDQYVKGGSTAAVELPVEAAHRTVEGNVVAKAAVTGLVPLDDGGPALDGEDGDTPVVENRPPLAVEAEAPVEIVHVEPVALVEEPDIVQRL